MIFKRPNKTEIKTKSFTDYVNFDLILSKQIRFLFLIIGFLFFHYTSWSQIITIKNQNTGTVVEHVFIYNSQKTNSTYSDEQGNFNLKEFSESDSIHFQHPSFYEISFSFSELQKQTIIYLVEHILEMDEFIVSANKWEESYSEIPNTIISINSKQIEFRNPPTSADLLESTGKVFVQKSQLGGGSPMIRGFAANSILIIVDGVRMNNAMFRSGNLQNILNIDPMALESSEVIFGPGSVLYGSDALGGVIDFHTKTSPFTKEKEFNVGVKTRYATANSEKTAGINFGYSAKKISFFTHFTYSSFGDLRMGSRFTNKFPDFGKRWEYVERINGTDQIVTNANPLIQKQSGYNQYSAVSKLVYQINEKQKLSYGFYLSNTGNIPRYDRLTQYNNGTLRFAEWNYGPQKWMRHSLTLENENKKKAFDESKHIISYQNFEESRITRSFNNTQRTSRTDILDALNFNFDFNKAFKHSRLFYGAEYIFNSIESSAFTKNIETKQIETT
ncbi:MAG: TonB-dependent receptor plug domain-containing protein, partial [Cyclobacteriaceae bacterium]|nr:TonB-dependent receptor plug domain-containing protein [Cyclobacteriaceae bacterium]